MALSTTTPKIDPKLIRELIGLAVVVVIVAGYFVFAGNASKPTTTTKTPGLNTTFETKALDQVDKKDNNYPTVNPGDVGRADPFAP